MMMSVTKTNSVANSMANTTSMIMTMLNKAKKCFVPWLITVVCVIA
eukprot:CAMPEP_0203680596 /NCGR_PEP_ID=MMETSP0090-20130426/39921_1 /ASSEMBLY_ACC=CAM_ASM_001088 /TAXON_ID=426623 /ORGANISM="Chaetoceros affinis, Strain CCMP159" /LENGTH=45 /DNA_ID= /DNA_START= /DNA_END= /DNA_ORIENTATION=